MSSSSDLRMAGHVALVTGVSDGIGRALAEVLTSYGAHVIGMARRAEQGAALEEAVRESGQGSFTFVEGDVSKAADCERAVQTCVERYDRIDSLVNNAGITGSPNLGPLSETTEETWDRVHDVNLRGAFLMTRAVLPIMKRQSDGVVLNIASYCAYWGIEGLAAYNASKAGLLGLNNTIAVEGFPSGIRSNVIILGATDTAASSGSREAVRAKAKESKGPKALNLMAPRDVAQSLAVLCLPEARMITGAAITIDQAMVAGRAMGNLRRLLNGVELD